jgi:transitional endoplasmic reticulum ATPase
MLALDPYKHRVLFRGITAGLAAAFTYFLTGTLPYYPAGWRLLLVIAVGVVWFFHPRWGGVTACLAYVLPALYNFSIAPSDRVVAIVVTLAVALLALLLLKPYSFLVLAGTTAVFAVPSLAGLLLFAPFALGFLGARRGAVASAFACFWGELLMLLGGRPNVGLLTGGAQTHPLLTLRSAPVKSLLDFTWLTSSNGAAAPSPSNTPVPGATPASTATPAHIATPAPSPVQALPATHTPPPLIAADFFAKLFTPFIERPILLGQIGLWAVAAGVTAALVFRPQLRHMPPKLPRFLPAATERVRAFLDRPLVRRIPARLLGIASGALVLGIGQLVLAMVLTQSSASIGTIAGDVLLPAALVALAAPFLETAPPALVPSDPSPIPVSTEPLAVGGTGRVAAFPQRTSARREIPADTWSELAGVADIQQELLEAIESQFNPRMRELLRRLSLRSTRGILLFGPPGTGKTKLARVIAHEAGAAFFAVSGTEFTSKWVGESEANLRRIFEEARENRPAVLFFDELEAFLPKRSEMMHSDGHEKGVVATFLGYTDGIGDMEGVLLVGATNYPNLIDPAALRPGRFDKLIYVSAPDQAARQQILERYLAGKPLAPDVDSDKLAARTERFTGADIQAVCEQATRRALARGGRTPDLITMADLESAIGGTKPSVTIKMLGEYEAMADQYSRRSEKPETVEVVARPVLSWDDVAGLEPIKDALREAIEMPLTHPELFKEYGVKPSKGVLLFGPPGCGKTFLAKVVASQAKAHFLHIKGPELLQQYVGSSELQLREVFIRARENAPCVLFFDEIDALTGARGTADAGHTQILTQLLTEMDGVDELKGVIVVAATNRPDTIDPALLRPGRLDRILYVPPPDRVARLDLIKKDLAGKPVADDLDYELLADLTGGYSSADITAICNAAALASAKESLRLSERQVLTTRRLREQIERTPRSITPAEIAEYERLRDQLQR